MPPRAAPPRGGARGSGGASAGGGAKRTAFSPVTTPAKAGDADQGGGGGGGGNKYAKLQKLTPSKAKKSSALRVSLTRDRTEVTNFRVCCCGRVLCWMIPPQRRSSPRSRGIGSVVAFPSSVRFSQRPGMRCAHIRGGARYHGLDRDPGRRRRDPHPASRIVPAPRLVWTRPRDSPRGYYHGACPRSQVLCVPYRN